MPKVSIAKLASRLGLAAACMVLMGFTLQPYHWPAKVVPIYFRFDPLTYNGAFNDAMNKWNVVSPNFKMQNGSGSLIFATGTYCSPEANSALFAYSVCGAQWGENVLAVTVVKHPGTEAVHGAVIFNSNQNFTLYNGPVRPNEVDFGRVALHELGHFAGLNHEVNQPAIMHPFVSAQETLTADDIAGIRARYP